jgi:DtxR family transcriptional regulator, Mn-dependent transcriptional regulator
MATTTIERYLKVLYELQEHDDRIRPAWLATRLNVSASAVTRRLQRLGGGQPRLVAYDRQRGVTLTPAGRQIALGILRRHRLFELYLQEALGYTWDTVYAEAERLAYVPSAVLEAKLAAALGQPRFDPHGDPIPTPDGGVPSHSRLLLAHLRVGQTGRVTRVRDHDPGFLRHLSQLGISLGRKVKVVTRQPFGGPSTILVLTAEAGLHHALGDDVTERIYVEAAPT